MTTVANMSTNAKGVISNTTRRAVKVSSPPKAPMAAWKKTLGVPALVAGFAAAQITLFSPGAAIAEIDSATYVSQPSIDLLSESQAADVITEIEDAEIPLLQVKLGKLASTGNVEAVAAAERQLQAIEREAALIAEEESIGDTGNVVQQTGGLLSEIGALKGMMRGMSE